MKLGGIKAAFTTKQNTIHTKSTINNLQIWESVQPLMLESAL